MGEQRERERDEGERGKGVMDMQMKKNAGKVESVETEEKRL